ncbi:unnamed protein product [Parascedosporium putredinis]|uniref:Small ribosomal subunit protein uS7 domain-containing protein n=1 Tax=Parascedosporium putredinis TaxID=1442378 RepID=A0A9P1HCB1_9PEZI|nr:unnamed protein product [Parascedosporium putredinis]CAI8004599.1 unnamed protein product [Parascedosporium putredinis]
MSPPIRVWGACRTLAIRARPTTKPIQGSIALAATVSKRSLATDGGKSAGPSGSDVEAMLQAAVTGGVLKAHGLAGGLTPAQEQTLYEEGIIKPAATGSQALDEMTAIATGLHLRGLAGGGAALEMPMPLEVRQRRRIAFQWILETVNKKPSMGSGRNQFAHRLASEIIAVVEGRSGVWDKRQQVHKLATAARANLTNKKKAKSKKG